MNKRNECLSLSDGPMLIVENDKTIKLSFIYGFFTVFSVAWAIVNSFSPPGFITVVTGVVFGRTPAFGTLPFDFCGRFISARCWSISSSNESIAGSLRQNVNDEYVSLAENESMGGKTWSTTSCKFLYEVDKTWEIFCRRTSPLGLIVNIRDTGIPTAVYDHWSYRIKDHGWKLCAKYCWTYIDSIAETSIEWIFVRK